MRKRALVLMSVFCIALIFALVACTPTTSSATAEPSAAKSASSGDVPTAWAMDIECAPCHINEAATATNPDAMLAIHTEQGTECVTCHTQPTQLAAAHRTMSTDVSKLSRLKRTKIAETICTDCHGGWEDLAALTAASGVTIDDAWAVAEQKITLEQFNYKPVPKVINPHIVKTTLNTTGSHDLVTCTSCHQTHVVGSTPQEAYKAGCASCHHTGVFTCNVCHT